MDHWDTLRAIRRHQCLALLTSIPQSGKQNGAALRRRVVLEGGGGFVKDGLSAHRRRRQDHSSQ
jgi:hypothetical protein